MPVRSFFDPISGRRKTMEVKPVDREQKFRTTQSSFSRYPTENRTCYQCGEKGHLSANCPQKVRRVSLTEGVIKYKGAGGTRPRVRLQGNMGSVPQETSEFDDVRPEDLASQVGGQYLGTMSGDYEEVFAASAANSYERGAQRLQGADQVCRRSLPRHLHQCSHHQHRSFLRSSAKTHLRKRLLLHRPDPMSCVPSRLRGRQSRHRQ